MLFLVGGEDDSCRCLAVDGELGGLVAQQSDEVFLCVVHCRGEFPSVECEDIHNLQGGLAGTHMLVIFRLFLGFLHLFYQVLAQEVESRFHHRGGVLLLANHVVQANERLGDAHGHVGTARHAGPPAPRAVVVLQFFHLVEGSLQAAAEQRLVEVECQVAFLCRLALGHSHPRRLGEHEVFQFLVFLERTGQTTFVRLLLPFHDILTDGGRKTHDIAADGVGIIGRSLAHHVVAHQGGEAGHGLDDEPSRIIGILHGEFSVLDTLGEELVEFHGHPSGSMLREGIGAKHHLMVGQYGQVMLLAVGIAFSAHGHSAHIERQFAVGLDIEEHAAALSGLQAVVLGLLVDGFHCLRVEEREGSHTVYRLLGVVEDPCGQCGPIVDAEEARHIGLHHDVFLRHCFSRYLSVVHLLVGGQCHHLPGGHAFGQGEFQHHISLLVGQQIGQEEGGLAEILAQRHLFALCLRCGRSLFLFGSGSRVHGFFIHDHFGLQGLHLDHLSVHSPHPGALHPNGSSSSIVRPISDII